MILAGCPKDGIVLDPFMGSGTTAVVAKLNRRNYIGTELNPEYIKMAENRINNTSVAIELFDIDSLDRRNSDCE
jgi:DNA modification methylase